MFIDKISYLSLGESREGRAIIKKGLEEGSDFGMWNSWAGTEQVSGMESRITEDKGKDKHKA